MCWCISIGVQMCLHMPREPPDVLTNLYGSTDVLHSLRHSGVFRNVQKAPHVEMHYYRTPDVFNNLYSRRCLSNIHTSPYVFLHKTKYLCVIQKVSRCVYKYRTPGVFTDLCRIAGVSILL